MPQRRRHGWGDAAARKNRRCRNRQVVSQPGKTATTATNPQPWRAGSAGPCCPKGGVPSGLAAEARTIFNGLVPLAAPAETAKLLSPAGLLRRAEPVPPFGDSLVMGDAREE